LNSTDVWFLIALSAAGLAVWGVFARRAVRGAPLLPPMPDERPTWNAGVVIVAAALGTFHIGTRLSREWQLLTEPAPKPGLPPVRQVIGNLQAGLLQNALLVALLLLILSQFGKVSLRQFGVRGDRWRWDLAAGGLGFLAAMPAVVGVILLTSPLRSKERTHDLILLLQNNPSFEACFWVGLTVIASAPLYEELLFRVVLQGALRSKLKATAAIGLSSVAFALVHGFPDSLALLPLAVVLGFVFERRRSWLAVVVAHGLFNGTMLVLTML
jgi:CAAX protease family protein